MLIVAGHKSQDLFYQAYSFPLFAAKCLNFSSVVRDSINLDPTYWLKDLIFFLLHKLTSFCSSWFSLLKKALMTKTVLSHNCILVAFQDRNVPFAGRHADESLHPISMPYSAMPCNMLKMKLRMLSQCFWPSAEGVVFILSNFRHLTWTMELLCLLDLFMLLDEITICSWVSERCVSLSHSGLGTELLTGAKWAILQSFLLHSSR